MHKNCATKKDWNMKTGHENEEEEDEEEKVVVMMTTGDGDPSNATPTLDDIYAIVTQSLYS